MNRLELKICVATVSTAIILVLFDRYRLVETPLSFFGVNHWIPEMILMFFVGKWIFLKMERTVVPIIVFCVALYPVITYGLIYRLSGLTLGVGTGTLFVVPLLIGIREASKKKENEK